MKTITAILEDENGNVTGYETGNDPKTDRVVFQTPVKRQDLEADKFAKLMEEKQVEIPGFAKPKAKQPGAPELYPEKAKESQEAQQPQ